MNIRNIIIECPLFDNIDEDNDNCVRVLLFTNNPKDDIKIFRPPHDYVDNDEETIPVEDRIFHLSTYKHLGVELECIELKLHSNKIAINL